MATTNQKLPARLYTKQYAGILKAVFGARNAFGDAFAPIQMKDGVAHNTNAFSVKTCGTGVTIGTYSTGANVAFGTGTSNSNRFGQMVEVIYQDTDVPYTYTLAIHEGIDRFTVNNDFNAAIADRLRLHAEAQLRQMNTRNGAYIASVAGNSETLSAMTEAGVVAMFNSLAAEYADMEIVVPVTAYVTPEVYNILVDCALATTAKHSSANIDAGVIYDFKGFKVVRAPSQYFASGYVMYFSPSGVFIPFVGIETARTVESEDFDGVRLQAAARGGQFILDDNKAAVTKVAYTPAP